MEACSQDSHQEFNIESNTVAASIEFGRVYYSCTVHILVGGWPTPLKKYEFVSWDNYSQYHKIHVPNHQPDYVSTSACTWHESNHHLGYLDATIYRCSCSDLKTVNCAGLLQLLRILGQKQLLHARSSGHSGPGSGACFGFGRDSATFVCFGSRKIRKSNGIAGVFSEYSDIF